MGIKIDCYSWLFCVSEVLIFNYVYIFQIVMEYCGAGSVSDIMRLRRKVVSKNAKHEFWQIFYLTSFSSFSVKCAPLMYVCMKNVLVCSSNVWIQEAVAKSDKGALQRFIFVSSPANSFIWQCLITVNFTPRKRDNPSI